MPKGHLSLLKQDYKEKGSILSSDIQKLLFEVNSKRTFLKTKSCQEKMSFLNPLNISFNI